MKIKELRLGNFLTTDGEVFAVTSITDSVVWAGEQGINSIGFDAEEFGIPLTEEWLLMLGFEKLPHFTVTHSIIKNIGRNRIISVGSIGTGNEMVWLCEIDPFEPKHITDLICVHNQDYDGRLMVHQLQNLYFALTSEELVYKV